MTDLKGKRVAILVTDGFEQIELTSPKEALEKAGAKCVIIAPKDGKVQSFKHHDKADRFNVDLTLAAYNAGPELVAKVGPRATQEAIDYVAAVKGYQVALAAL